MGSRKRNSAEKIKEAKKDLAFAKLNNCPTSPRKMRLVADQIRGEDISSALSILKFSPKEASRRLEKLLVSAISNWQSKNENSDIDSAQLFVKEIRVDSAGMLKRIRTDPHSLGEFRTNTTLSNIPEFLELFEIKEGDKMFRKNPVQIW